MEKEKLEAIKQWTNDPCGSVYAKKYRYGSCDFFEAIRKYRYEIYAPWLKKIIDRIDTKNKRLLEIGCGIGNDLLCFAQNGAKVIGIDLVPKHLDLAKKLFTCYGCSGRFLKMDAENLELPPNYVDLIYSFGVLHHTPNIKKAILEIHRVLRPGGLVVVGLYNKNSWYFWVNLILIKGLIKGKLFRMSVDEFLSTNVEFSRSGAKPLVKVYSKSECAALFRDFFDIKIEKYHWKSDQIPKIGKFLPTFLPSFLGWYILVFARKK